MAIVKCPECQKKLKVADTSIGKKVRCSCSHVFIAETEDAAPVVAAAPMVAAAPEKVIVACTECSAKLKVATTSLGKKMKCPKCTSVFVASVEEEAPPAKPVKKAPAAPVVAEEDDEEPKAKPLKKKGDDDDDDFFTFGQEEAAKAAAADDSLEEDDMPRGKAKPKKRNDDDDEDEPKPKAKPPRMQDDDEEEAEKPVYPSRVLPTLLATFLLLVYAGLFAFVFFGLHEMIGMNPVADELRLPKPQPIGRVLPKIVDGDEKDKDAGKDKNGGKDKDNGKEQENKKEAAKLNGAWIVVSAEMNGKSHDAMKGLRLIFTDGIVASPDEPMGKPFSVDASRDPKWINLPTVAAVTVPGIYKLDGDNLQWCTGLIDKDRFDDRKLFHRPTKFDSKEGLLVTLKREKTPNGKPDAKDKGKDGAKANGKDEETKKDAAKLEGQWAVETHMYRGKSHDGVKGYIFEFVDGKFFGPHMSLDSFTLFVWSDPKKIHVTRKLGGYLSGTYKFDGEKLHLCFTRDIGPDPDPVPTPGGVDKPVPTPRDADYVDMYVLRRATKDDIRKFGSVKNLMQIGLAIHTYTGENGGRLPPAASSGSKDPTGKPLLSWRVAILPYLDQQALYKEFDLDQPWDHPTNLKLVAKMPKLYVVPGVEAKEGMTHYRTLVGPGTFLEPHKGKDGRLATRYKIGATPDGTSQVIAVVEATEPTIWTKPDDLAYDPKGPLPKFGVTPAGFNVLFADASTRFVPSTVSEKVLRPYLTGDNGMRREPLGADAVKGKEELPKTKESDKEIPKDKGKDDTRLHGGWVIESAVLNGKSDKNSKGLFMEFADGTFTAERAWIDNHPYSVIASMDPGWIDITEPVRKGKSAGTGKPVTMPAIYKFEGDKLHMAWPFGVTAPLARPAGFDEKNSLVFVLRRVTKDDSRYFRHKSFRNLSEINKGISGASKPSFPPAASSGKDDATGKPLLSWRVTILPYVGHQALYKEFDLDKPWDDPHNLKLIAKMPKVYMVPGVDAKEGMTHYRTPVGPDTLLEPIKGPGGKLVTKHERGTIAGDPGPQIIMVVEATEPTIWTKPDDLPYDPKGPLPKLGVTPAGFMVLFADHNIYEIRANVPEDTLRPYFTCKPSTPRNPLPRITGEEKGKVKEPEPKKQKDTPNKERGAESVSFELPAIQETMKPTWIVPTGWNDKKATMTLSS